MVMPIERAVPATIFSAASTSLALRSGILVSAISRSWSLVMDPTLVFCGTPEPDSMPAALSSRRAAGGVLVMKVKLRSSNTEISTGTTMPRCDSVCALYCLQNSMMLTPCWPSAGPTGGAGVAAPAWICSLMTAASFFLGGMSGSFVVTVAAGFYGVAPRSGTILSYVRTCLDLLHLVERELDRCLPAEDRDQDLELLRVGVDLADRRREGRERAVHDGDRLADLEVGGLGLDDLLLLLLLRGQELHDLVEG